MQEQIVYFSRNQLKFQPQSPVRSSIYLQVFERKYLKMGELGGGGHELGGMGVRALDRGFTCQKSILGNATIRPTCLCCISTFQKYVMSYATLFSNFPSSQPPPPPPHPQVLENKK